MTHLSGAIDPRRLRKDTPMNLYPLDQLDLSDLVRAFFVEAGYDSLPGTIWDLKTYVKQPIPLAYAAEVMGAVFKQRFDLRHNYSKLGQFNLQAVREVARLSSRLKNTCRENGIFYIQQAVALIMSDKGTVYLSGLKDMGPESMSNLREHLYRFGSESIYCPTVLTAGEMYTCAMHSMTIFHWDTRDPLEARLLRNMRTYSWYTSSKLEPRHITYILGVSQQRAEAMCQKIAIRARRAMYL